MANSYLSFTQAAGTSRRKFTYSVWMKRSTDNTSGNYNSGFFNCWSDANNRLAAYFYDNKLYLYGLSGGSANISVRTNRLFRDLSAWYHIVIAVDTTQSTAADRVKFYVNGVQETSLDQTTYPAQDHDLPSVGVNAKAIELQAEADAEKQSKIDLKASAKAKLVAGEPLTEAEADTIVL